MTAVPSPVSDRDRAEVHAPAWTYTVSVRSLCEFSAKHGDLDRRFSPSATALEGLAGQQTVASRRGPDYQAELALEGVHGALRVRGRADGYDPRRRRLEEVKTLRGPPDALPQNKRQLHWAQLQTYGALYCRTHGLTELSLALVYFDVDTQTETEWPQHLQRRRTRGRVRPALRPVPRLGRTGSASSQRARRGAAGPGLSDGAVPARPARSVAGGLPHGARRPLPARAGAHRHRQDPGHAVPGAARDARRRLRQDRLT